MKRIPTYILLGFLAAAGTRANTPLTINGSPPYACLQNAYIGPTPILQATANFTLSGASGTATIASSVPASAPTFGYPPEVYVYAYTIDLNHLSSTASNCVKLVVHFGAPNGCGYDAVYSSPSAIQSATLAPFGDITFEFAGGCLSPGQPAVPITMFSGAAPKIGVVTVIDDYVGPNGQNLELSTNITAVVPDIPPNPPPWLFPVEFPFPYVFFQGALSQVGTNQSNTNKLPVTGAYDFTLQLLNAPSNALAVSELATQTVQVVNGLFTVPLPFDPITMGDGSSRWLNIGVRPSGLPAVQFTPVGPPLPITPAPQANYAYTAGVVADLTPGQAVTSLNGLTDAVNLQAANGILLGTNGNTLTVAVIPGYASDRNLKTGFASIQPRDILDRLAALPIEAWRYTNEPPDIHHIGPMAQDFQAAFGLGTDGKIIYFADASGVTLAAIQGLNEKLDARDRQIQSLEQQNALLSKKLEALTATVESLGEQK
ncbi:MAG: tail fiber domain-containing protein [Verrucomicrobiota bacterium]|jgi:hypothetical protein